MSSIATPPHPSRLALPARSLALSAATAAAVILVAATPAAAQSRSGLAPAGPTVELTPYAGYMMLGDVVKGPYGTDLGGSGGYVLGGQLALRLTPSIALVGNVAHATSDLKVGVPILGGFGVGSMKVWMYDAGLQLGVPVASRGGMGIAPFVQLGAGAMHHTVGASFLETTATNFAGNVGLGADFQLAPNIAVRLLARDYIGRFDIEEATGIGTEAELSHNVALTAGLRVSF
ncbi:MAG TPA: outer membrane beta-barrel protein [Gemmatimonadales bacterium]